MSTDHEPILITARQAAELLSISERTLWQLTNDGKAAAVCFDERYGMTCRISGVRRGEPKLQFDELAFQAQEFTRFRYNTLVPFSQEYIPMASITPSERAANDSICCWSIAAGDRSASAR
ncbi:MAG: hypothetical protein U1D30_10910 [Planctomycetota bacterium]